MKLNDRRRARKSWPSIYATQTSAANGSALWWPELSR